MKKSKLKDYYKILKELWAIPKYRSIIKLSLYGIMFLTIFIMAHIYNEIQTMNKNTDDKLSFSEILKSTNLENVEVNYKINDINNNYSIEGEITNNILTAYIEYNGIIKKIKVDDNYIYNIVNNNEIIDEELNSVLNKEFLLPKNIFDIINTETAFIEKQENFNIYTYNINYNNIFYEVKLMTNLEQFTNINISSNNINYNLNVNFDKLP